MNKTLFKISKSDTVEQWNIQVVENKIIVTWGKVDGKQQIKEEVILTGKNIGKANETTPAQQALLEAESTYKHKLDKGYATTISDAQIKSQEIKPILLEDYTKRVNKKKIIWSDGVLVQPKLDGIRSHVSYETSKLKTKSRGNKEFPVNPNLFKQIEDFMKENNLNLIDGEFYCHGEFLEDISSSVKNPIGNRLEHQIQFHIFDLPINRKPMEFYNHSNTSTNYPNVKMVKGTIVYSEEEARKIMDVYLSEGFEGCILRNKSTFMSDYELGGIRTSEIQKWKDFVDAEYEIVDIESDKNNNAIYVCKTQENKFFNATPKCTHEKKKEILANKKYYLNKMLTVRYQDLTPDGLPRFARGITVRDYE